MTDDPAGPHWLLGWARRLESLAATGLHYTQNPYDVQRYEYLRDIAAEMLAHCSDEDVEAVRGRLAGVVGPGTPKLVVRSAVFRENKLLMVRESADNAWAMPGGWAEVNERPSRAAEREVFEETGFEVRARRLFYLHDPDAHGPAARAFHIYTAYFLCDLVGGEPATSLETTEIGFFAEDDLPPLSLSRNGPREIALAFAAHRNPENPAAFD